jgi:hypothetical protein
MNLAYGSIFSSAFGWTFRWLPSFSFTNLELGNERPLAACTKPQRHNVVLGGKVDMKS